MKNICPYVIAIILDVMYLNKDNNIVSLLKEWEQKVILFPNRNVFYNNVEGYYIHYISSDVSYKYFKHMLIR